MQTDTISAAASSSPQEAERPSSSHVKTLLRMKKERPPSSHALPGKDTTKPGKIPMPEVIRRPSAGKPVKNSEAVFREAKAELFEEGYVSRSHMR